MDKSWYIQHGAEGRVLHGRYRHPSVMLFPPTVPTLAVHTDFDSPARTDTCVTRPVSAVVYSPRIPLCIHSARGCDASDLRYLNAISEEIASCSTSLVSGLSDLWCENQNADSRLFTRVIGQSGSASSTCNTLPDSTTNSFESELDSYLENLTSGAASHWPMITYSVNVLPFVRTTSG